jgi:hypothetical protein
MIAGIDMIFLHTTDFKVGDRALLDVNKTEGPKRKLHALFQDSSGMVLGSKAFHNSKGVGVNINRDGMQVVFNPSKYFHPYELLTDTRKLSDVLKHVESELHQVKIKANLLECGLSRLDLTKQIYMPEPVYTYGNAFRSIKAKRAPAVSFPDGYRWGNKTWEVQFYDKGIELIANKFLKSESPINLMRGEVKYKRSAFLKKNVGIKKMSDLIQAGPDHLTSCYNKILLKNVFQRKTEGEQLPIQFMEELEVLQFYMSRIKRGALGAYKNSVGIETIIERAGGIDGYKRLLEHAGYSQGYISKEVNSIREQIEIVALIKMGRKETSIGTILMHVQNAFAA